jgi:hypothetical protein
MPFHSIPNVWRGVYNLIAIPTMFLVFHALAFLARVGFHRVEKIRLGIDGCKRLFAELAVELQKVKKPGLRFWVHAASMGEYEQARPLLLEIEKIPGSGARLDVVFAERLCQYQARQCPGGSGELSAFDSVHNARRFCIW